MTTEYIAHVKQQESGRWETHLLEEHLLAVAELAEKFAQPFYSKDWGYLAGLWHDLGKYRRAFQAHIKKSSGYEPDAHITSEKNSNTSHASTGAVYAIKKLRDVGQIIAYLIAGHHAGLPDFEVDGAPGRALKEIFNKDQSLLQEAAAPANLISLLYVRVTFVFFTVTQSSGDTVPSGYLRLSSFGLVSPEVPQLELPGHGLPSRGIIRHHHGGRDPIGQRPIHGVPIRE